MKSAVVVAHYNENLNWLEQIKDFNSNIYVYAKGNGLKFYKKLPNIGREAHTYLTFLVEEYNKLTSYEYIIFLQGSPSGHSINIEQKIFNISTHSLFLNYNNILLPYNSEELLYNDRNGQPHMFPPVDVGSESDRLFQDKIDRFPFVPGAQMFVPVENILCRTQSFFRHCLQANWNYEPNNQLTDGGPMACIYERLWLSIFDKNIKTII